MRADKRCECCGTMILNAHYNQKYCKPCAKKIERERTKYRDLMRVRKILNDRKEKENIDVTQCQTCLYRVSMFRKSETWFCGYCYFINNKRPCEPSPHCTVYQKYNQDARAELVKLANNRILMEMKERGDRCDTGEM